MNGLQVFNYEEKQVRTVQREDGLWIPAEYIKEANCCPSILIQGGGV